MEKSHNSQSHHLMDKHAEPLQSTSYPTIGGRDSAEALARFRRYNSVEQPRCLGGDLTELKPRNEHSSSSCDAASASPALAGAGPRLKRQQSAVERRPWLVPLLQVGLVGLVLAIAVVVAAKNQRITRRLFGGDPRPQTPAFPPTKQQPTPRKPTIANLPPTLKPLLDEETRSCVKTCNIQIVESIPQNVTFTGGPTSMSTFDAWMRLIGGAKSHLTIAAYKSSLRGKHVLSEPVSQRQFSSQGDAVYEAIVEAGLKRRVTIRMVENSPSKDKGDNADGISLQRIGAVQRRALNLRKMFNAGVMHSKFIVADGRDFYLGSANLDWRSLNQKMEMGIYVSDCPCMANDLNTIFDVYWRSAEAVNAAEMGAIAGRQPAARFNAAVPMPVGRLSAGGNAFLAASPQTMNAAARTWDLDAIVDAIRAAKTRIDVHVMDYFPMFMYGENKRFWPPIDNALREAILRGVNVRMIGAALHYPRLGLRFLESLEAFGRLPGSGSVEVRIFKVPSPIGLQMVIRRDRRTHKKFIVTDGHAIVGTSNWSGDYFDARGTGVAIVVGEDSSAAAETTTRNANGFIAQMRAIFERDWRSAYAHPLSSYLERCFNATADGKNGTASSSADICEPEKDVSLLANPAGAE